MGWEQPGNQAGSSSAKYPVVEIEKGMDWGYLNKARGQLSLEEKAKRTCCVFVLQTNSWEGTQILLIPQKNPKVAIETRVDISMAGSVTTVNKCNIKVWWFLTEG